MEPLVYHKWNTDKERSDGLRAKNAATVATTNAQGEATFGGLADGTYHLVETEAPPATIR